MDFEKLLKKRASVRRFADKDVPEELIRKIIQSAVYVPTPCNQQLWHFIAIKESGVKERLVDEACSSTIIERAPVAMVILYDGWNYKEAIQAGSMAAQNILLAAADYGLGSLALNSYGSDARIKEILNIPDSYQICCFILLGYPDDICKTAPPVSRRGVDEVLHYNSFDGTEIAPHSYNPEEWKLKHLVGYQRYYCRKTFLGKEMDISHPLEKEIIRKVLSAHSGPFLDLMTYDGSYLKEFPEGRIITIDTSEETMNYSRAATELNKEEPPDRYAHRIYDPSLPCLSPEEDISVVTMLYKAERLPEEVLENMIAQSYRQLKKGSKMIIISRRKGFLFQVFYRLIKCLFGDDIRKTGIYAFFGPYRPIDSGSLKRLIRQKGFNRVSEKRYFVIPPFFDQAYQMCQQYRRSEGSSYLHRMRREDFISRTISFLLKKQDMRENRFGSITVIEAEK